MIDLLLTIAICGLLVIITLYLLINVSSLIAALILLFFPLLLIVIIPDSAINFLAHEHVLLADGRVPVNNYHILFYLWSTLMGIILYTEFLTWYLAYKKKKR